MTDTLPPLPVADTHCFDEDTGEDVWSHSYAQMRTYALAAVAAEREAAASICENTVLGDVRDVDAACVKLARIIRARTTPADIATVVTAAPGNSTPAVTPSF